MFLFRICRRRTGRKRETKIKKKIERKGTRAVEVTAPLIEARARKERREMAVGAGKGMIYLLHNAGQKVWLARTQAFALNTVGIF